MTKTINVLTDQITGIRCGVISTNVLETVKINCYDQKSPIKQIANLSCDGKRICIEPYDVTILTAIDKGLKQAGFNSYIFSKTQVVVTFSALSGNEREKVKNQVNRLAEEARIAVRNCRKKARQMYEKSCKKVCEDDINKFDKSLQQLTNQKISEIDFIIKNKLEQL